LLADDSLQYEAISYTWGDETVSLSIEIDGKDYKIRRNLYQFIHILRRPHESWYLWADAICIDQTNLKEKSEQVSVIGQIFRQATVVRVWLGLHQDGSERVMDVIAREPSHSPQGYYHLPGSGRKMALDFKRLKQFLNALKFAAAYPRRALRQPKASDAFPEMSVRHGWWLLTQRERDEFVQHRSQLVALMNRGYWFRTWIVQEILLAQEV
jgi:Heterokaryon incompatibility protein (HET)